MIVKGQKKTNYHMNTLFKQKVTPPTLEGLYKFNAKILEILNLDFNRRKIEILEDLCDKWQ